MNALEAEPIETPEDLTGDPRTHLLFATAPLLRLLRGDKHAYLRRTWLAVANNLTSGFFPMHEGRLPTDPRDAALALFDAAIQVARTTGIDGPDLTAHYNNAREAGVMNSLVKSDEAIERATATLMVLMAWKLAGPR